MVTKSLVSSMEGSSTEQPVSASSSSAAGPTRNRCCRLLTLKLIVFEVRFCTSWSVPHHDWCGETYELGYSSFNSGDDDSYSLSFSGDGDDIILFLDHLLLLGSGDYTLVVRSGDKYGDGVLGSSCFDESVDASTSRSSEERPEFLRDGVDLDDELRRAFSDDREDLLSRSGDGVAVSGDGDRNQGSFLVVVGRGFDGGIEITRGNLDARAGRVGDELEGATWRQDERESKLRESEMLTFGADDEGS